ncbi:MAG: cation-transporting P-type ATPase, partial [Desulfobulbaceae bacterium]|nr:cation-transporting P-type ATPase [Desulfobulbaceae bacterium]
MKIRADEEAHFLSADEVGVLLESDLERGLSREDAESRLQQFGANTLTAKPGKPSWLRFLLQFHQPLIYILIAAGVVTAVLQGWVDSGVIFGVVLVNGIIGFIPESKAEGALLALADTMVA